MAFVRAIGILLACGLWAMAARAEGTGIDRLYILNCAEAHAPDQSRWSPGVNVGVPIDVSDNCYLIHHAQGYLLWDTGVTDKLQPGQQSGPIPWQKPKLLAAQLSELGVAPSQIRYVAISHTHPDHIGNVDQFPQATVLMQKAEYEWAFANGKQPFSPDHPVTKLEGDHDVFGDGSARIISTPGHTPGHESLLVHLPKTGYLLLSGDAVHFKSNWENRRVPAGNTDKDQTLASMEHINALLAQFQAELWINHDKFQSEHLRYAPQYYD